MLSGLRTEHHVYIVSVSISFTNASESFETGVELVESTEFDLIGLSTEIFDPRVVPASPISFPDKPLLRDGPKRSLRGITMYKNKTAKRSCTRIGKKITNMNSNLTVVPLRKSSINPTEHNKLTTSKETEKYTAHCFIFPSIWLVITLSEPVSLLPHVVS